MEPRLWPPRREGWALAASGLGPFKFDGETLGRGCKILPYDSVTPGEEAGASPKKDEVVYNLCMASKTISVKIEAYRRLKAAKRYATESFSQVILRARWPEETLTGAQLLRRGQLGASLSEEELGEVARLKREQRPPEDKWNLSG